MGAYSMELYQRGSEWRKWDLHVHTASSYDAEYKGTDSDELLCETLRNNNVAAVAISDHFIIDGKRISHLRELAPDIVFFPGVELRTDKGASNLHIILVFSENSNLNILEEDFNAIMLRNRAKAQNSNDTIFWTFEDIIEFAQGHRGLVSIHAGKKTNGIDKEITNATPVKEAIKEDIAKNIHFFEIGKKNDIDDYNNYVFKFIDEKPLIICSDNHDPRKYITKESLWIKADPTFEGLLQCLYQPRDRVFIGSIPPKLDIVQKNKRIYIESLSVKKVDTAKNSDEDWFDFQLPINSGLTVLIGNKGSGKSALSDIIGHLCKSKSMKEASFLNQDRFRKSPKNLANDYVANINWVDGDSIKNINLGVNDYNTTIENAQYLPQKFIENACNGLGNEFQDEINKVIYSYIDETEKGDAKNLFELISNKSTSILTNIKDIQNELVNINNEIIRLEEKSASQYKKELIDNLQKREDDLRRHDNSKPIEVKKPVNTFNEHYDKELKDYEINIFEIETEIKIKKDELTNINKGIDKLENTKGEVNFITNKIDQINKTLNEITNEFVFDTSLIINYSSPLIDIESKLIVLQDVRAILQTYLDSSEKADISFSLYKKLELIMEKRKSLIETTDGKEKEYQKYLDDIKEWEKNRTDIIGNAQIAGSIKCLQEEIDYINYILPSDYSNKKEERLLKVKSIFEQKKAIASLFSSMYEPMEKVLYKLLDGLEDKIEFAVDISLSDKEISTKLLDYINRSYTGVFNGKTESVIKMSELIKKTDFNNLDSINEFINTILECAYEDLDQSTKKIKNKSEFYNLLSCLDYVGVEYSLKMGGRNLQELSPGERGIVLLIFYLALSKNEIPLIIDQPEDNLDNQSIYKKLVRCICEAKNRRQVIIVTHNPNIAIACDAEQIIYSNIDKLHNRISYVSGSIENTDIRGKVIDVLEGTMPAFDLRRLKYTITF